MSFLIGVILVAAIIILGIALGHYLSSDKYLKNIRKNPKMIDRIRYLVTRDQTIAIGDLIRFEGPIDSRPISLHNAVLTVIQDNVYVVDHYGKPVIGFIALFDNKKFAISKDDCYKVKVSN